MLSQKVTSVFNPGFSFENESDALNSHFKLVKPAKPSPIDEEADLGEVIDNAEGDDIDNELESDNESKKELEKLTLEQDDSIIDKERVVMEKEAIMFGNLDKELA